MVKGKEFAIFTFGLCPLIPAASNFAYGIILSVSIWVVFFSKIFTLSFTAMLDIKRYGHIFSNIFTIGVITFFNFLLSSLFPVIHDAIKLYLYIFGVSYILFLSVQNYSEESESLDFPIMYSVLILAVSLIRELFSFGTISFPIPSGFLMIRLPYFSTYPLMRFIGTTAGSFILLGILSWLFVSIKNGGHFSFRGNE